MPTDQFLDSLAADLRPVEPRRDTRDLAVFAALAAVELAAFLTLDVKFVDLAAAVSSPSFWWKLTGLGLITLVSVVTAIRSFDPAKSPRLGLRLGALLIASALVTGLALDLSYPTQATVLERLAWQDGLRCVASMVGLSIPAIMALGYLMRRGAPTDRAGTSVAGGVAAASWGAFVFAFACPHFDPLYVVTWYMVGTAGIVIAARYAFLAVSRW